MKKPTLPPQWVQDLITRHPDLQERVIEAWENSLDDTDPDTTDDGGDPVPPDPTHPHP